MTDYKKSQPVVMLGAITTGLTVFFGGLTTVAGLQGNRTIALVCGVGMLLTAAINAGKDQFLKDKVVPLEDAAAYRNKTGDVVSGPADADNPDGAAVSAIVTEQPISTGSDTAIALEAGWTAEEIERAQRAKDFRPGGAA